MAARPPEQPIVSHARRFSHGERVNGKGLSGNGLSGKGLSGKGFHDGIGHLAGLPDTSIERCQPARRTVKPPVRLSTEHPSTEHPSTEHPFVERLSTERQFVERPSDRAM
jgi:hypothetical protein